MFIVQFITLFFGSPKPIYEQVHVITLNGTECYGVHENLGYMTLLTQRVSSINTTASLKENVISLNKARIEYRERK